MAWFIVAFLVVMAVAGGCWLALHARQSRRQLASIELERHLAEIRLRRLTGQAIRQIVQATRRS